jgi:hypothetical protein
VPTFLKTASYRGASRSHGASRREPVSVQIRFLVGQSADALERRASDERVSVFASSLSLPGAKG